jgi:hypothetical protein
MRKNLGPESYITERIIIVLAVLGFELESLLLLGTHKFTTHSAFNPVSMVYFEDCIFVSRSLTWTFYYFCVSNSLSENMKCHPNHLMFCQLTLICACSKSILIDSSHLRWCLPAIGMPDVFVWSAILKYHKLNGL